MSAPALKAATLYFLLVFAAGFVLGALRVMFIAPNLGALAAVAVELPVMLVLSWFACRFCLRRFAVPPHLRTRVVMGAIAFALLMMAEFVLGVLAFGQSPNLWLAALLTPPGALGLLGQIAFALFPLVMATPLSANYPL